MNLSFARLSLGNMESNSALMNSVLNLIGERFLIVAKICDLEPDEIISKAVFMFEEKLQLLQSTLSGPIEGYASNVQELIMSILIIGRIANLFIDKLTGRAVVAKKIVERLISVLFLVSPERNFPLNHLLAQL